MKKLLALVLATTAFGAAAQKAVASAETKEKFANIGLAPMPLSPDALKGFMTSEVTKWQRLAKEANVEKE